MKKKRVRTMSQAKRKEKAETHWSLCSSCGVKVPPVMEKWGNGNALCKSCREAKEVADSSTKKQPIISNKLEEVKARLRRDSHFAEVTVSRNGENLKGWIPVLSKEEISQAVKTAQSVNAEGSSLSSTKNEGNNENYCMCQSCHEENLILETTPKHGYSLSCVHCKNSLFKVYDAGYGPVAFNEKQVNIMFGYSGISLEHPRCPSCNNINYSVVFPQDYLSVPWYVKQKVSSRSVFYINVNCVHCKNSFIIEWDEHP